MRTLLQESSSAGAKRWALGGDVSKAHRRVKVREEDWGFQACRLDAGRVWVNTVGTYGMTSASYWWTRVAAGAIVRLFHYITWPSFRLELLLYVDDSLFTSHDQPSIEEILFGIWFLTSLGVPWAWRKFRGGTSLSWVGLWVSWSEYRLGRDAMLCLVIKMQ